MNFFEQQARARRRTHILVLLFAAAVVAIIAVVNFIFLAVWAPETPDAPFLSEPYLRRHLDLLFWTTLLTAGLIGFASLYRTLGLQSGGGGVARQLGGTPVQPDTTDPLRRRLRNVVEEMAIASGVPVPEIYVLEQEAGINAFAAGYSPADAAIAVTRGALENLNRTELQGVVAHEFGHILNGDMRLNIRLMGILFGILAMALIGQRVLFAMRYSRRSRESGGIVALGLALMAVGYIGLFFGRWIKATVSRQREYLADASAVQFTRQPDGIAGALKKIGALQAGSSLQTDSEEVGHMLFARGRARQLFATHPPLINRIRAIEPGFEPAEFRLIAERLQRHSQVKRAAGESAVGAAAPRPGGLPLEADTLIDRMGRPGVGQILGAALLVERVPSPLERAAHSNEWAPEVVCYLLMDPDPAIRERQQGMVAEALGAESEAQLRHLLEAVPTLAPELRLPLLEIAFPALRRQPEAELDRLLALIERLIHADGRVDVFEYALARLFTRQLEDARRPTRARTAGHRRLADTIGEVRDLVSIVAHHGHADPLAARAALAAGLRILGEEAVSIASPDASWPERLDAALEGLDTLRLGDKERLLHALVATITHGGETVLAEVELLRAICAALHLPLPPLEPVGGGVAQASSQ